MGDYRRQLQMSASPAEVYRFLSTTEGLRAWWTTTCEVAESVGGLSHFRFGPHHKTMRVVTLIPEREVRWHCTDALIAVPSLPRQDEWVNTDIVFKLVPLVAGGTKVDFEHIGLTPALACFNMCRDGWDEYLESLRNLANTGRGRPFQESLAPESA